MLRIRELVVNVISREVRHRLIDFETERLIGRASRSRNRERKALSLVLDGSILPISVRFLKQNGTRTGPVQAKGSIGDLVKQVQILYRRVVEPIGRADAGFTRSAEDFAQKAVVKPGGIGKTDPRTEIVVSGGRKSLGNAWIFWNYELFW